MKAAVRGINKNGDESIYWISEMRKLMEDSILLKSVSLLQIQHVFMQCKLG